jgi:large subunit ribosomal protein L4
VSTTTPVTGPVTVPVYNRQGQATGSVQVDAAEFGGKINRQLLHDVVIMHLANQRAGTHSTLRRGEVAGSTKKLFRQKGTGNARAGTRRTNKRRGGGTAKGPKPRDYEYHLPKKAVRSATRMAILSKLQDNEALVVEDLALSAIKTKEIATVLKALKTTLESQLPKPAPEPGAEGEPPAPKLKRLTWLIGIKDYDENLYKSARNIAGVKLLPTSQFNAYTILRQKRLLLTREALEELRKGPPSGKAEEKQVEGAPAQA